MLKELSLFWWHLKAILKKSLFLGQVLTLSVIKAYIDLSSILRRWIRNKRAHTLILRVTKFTSDWINSLFRKTAKILLRLLKILIKEVLDLTSWSASHQLETRSLSSWNLNEGKKWVYFLLKIRFDIPRKWEIYFRLRWFKFGSLFSNYLCIRNPIISNLP